MKKQLLILGLGLFGTVASWAQLSSPYQGAQPSKVVDESADFYLYNVKTGKWLEENRKYASAWSTRGELGDNGFDVEITCLQYDEGDGDDMYQINPKFGHNKSLNWSGLYLDTDQAKTEWIFEAATDVDVPNAFYIIANAGDYNSLQSDENARLVCAKNNYTENEVWQLVTREERLEYMINNATSDNGMDATWLIANPHFAREDSRASRWIVNIDNTGHTDDINHGPVAAIGGDSQDFPGSLREFWSSWSASITQTIKNVPNGTYKMGVQGYYREWSADISKDWNEGDPLAYDLWSTNSENKNAKYFANGASAPLMSIFDGAKDAFETGYEYNADMHDPELGDVVKSPKWVPNSVGQAAYAFFNDPTAYQNPEITASVADGNLTIGVKKEQGVNDDWIIIDNFKLTYYGSEIDLDQVKNALQQAITAGEACTARSTEAINKMYDNAMTNGKDILANSTDAAAIAAATTAINEAVELITATATNAGFLIQTVAICKNEGVTGEAMETATDVSVNGVTADAINTSLDAIRLARRLNAAETHENVFTGNAPAAGESYYLYNVGQKRFFCGGDDWGAHASLGFPGIAIVLEAPAEGGEGFVIDTRLQNGDGQHYLNYGGYCDTGVLDLWSFKEVGNGVYNIARTNPSEEELANGNILLGYRPGRYSTVDTDMIGTDDANNQWILVTKADRDALLENASEGSPVDASYLIKMPNFNQREYQITGGWDNTDADDYAWDHQNGSICERGSNRTDFAFECYNQDPLVLTQTVTDLLPGYYVLSVQGYYRDCNEVDYTKLLAEGDYTPSQLAILTAVNGSKEEASVPLATIDAEANMAPGLGWNSGTTVGWIPNHPDHATQYYFQNGLYKSSVIAKVGEDGVLTIEVTKDGGIEKDWVCVDNFRLKYLGKDTPTAIDGITDNETAKDGKIYNLQGVQLKDATKRGVYIQNGKKFVVK